MKKKYIKFNNNCNFICYKKIILKLFLAQKKNYQIYKRGDMLGHITSLTKNIVVVGSHGKTTTSLVASILSLSNLDPTIINGGVLNRQIILQDLEKAIGA